MSSERLVEFGGVILEKLKSLESLLGTWRFGELNDYVFGGSDKRPNMSSDDPIDLSNQNAALAHGLLQKIAMIDKLVNLSIIILDPDEEFDDKLEAMMQMPTYIGPDIVATNLMSKACGLKEVMTHADMIAKFREEFRQLQEPKMVAALGDVAIMSDGSGQHLCFVDDTHVVAKKLEGIGPAREYIMVDNVPVERQGLAGSTFVDEVNVCGHCGVNLGHAEDCPMYGTGIGTPRGIVGGIDFGKGESFPGTPPDME